MSLSSKSVMEIIFVGVRVAIKSATMGISSAGKSLKLDVSAMSKKSPTCKEYK
tara:strand:+ start:640 stop:798 length:159 start_codon:yes stop_codon:yes gene_type:complete